jgi:hypothetical protein
MIFKLLHQGEKLELQMVQQGGGDWGPNKPWPDIKTRGMYMWDMKNVGFPLRI